MTCGKHAPLIEQRSIAAKRSVVRDVPLEQDLGLLSLCVMEIETLNNAARAAGFAMAASDEPHEEPKREMRGDEGAWQSQALIPLHLAADQPKGDWLRNMIDLVWGRAPASPV